MKAPTIYGAGVLGKEVKDAGTVLDTFDLPDSVGQITYTSDEVTAVCPITGQPDWYTVKVVLTSSQLGIESKSLKLYLQSFRNEGAFCEALADIIATDVSLVTKAGSVQVTVNQKSRGGITIEAHSWKTNRRYDGEGEVEQDIPVRGSTSPAEP